MKICFFLTNDYINDSRVVKESESLSKQDSVTGIVYYKNKRNIIKKDNLTVKQVIPKFKIKNPIISFLNLLYAWFLFIIYGLKEKSDLYWANDLTTLPPAYFVALLKRKKVIYDSHELFLEMGNKRNDNLIWRSFERFIIKRVNLVIVPNELRKNYIENKYNIRNIEILHNYPSKSQIDKDFIKDKIRYRFIYYGGLVNRNLENIIMAFGEIDKYLLDNVDFIICGDEKEYSKLLPLIKEYNLESVIRFAGYVNQNELKEYESISDFGFLLYPQTNYNNIYAAPNKLYTYLNNGCLAITNVESLSSDILDYGFVISDNYKNIKENIIKYLSISKEELLVLQKEARDYSNNKFIWEEEKLLKLIKL